MAGDVIVTVVGNLADDPQLRYTQGGIAVVSVRVGSTPRVMNRQTSQWEDGETIWVTCTAWREVAENIAQSLTKGTRVVVSGRLKPASAYQTASGEARASVELEIEEIGPSLRYATAAVTRRAREWMKELTQNQKLILGGCSRVSSDLYAAASLRKGYESL